MEILNHGAGRGYQPWYVNPNNRSLTSDRKNTGNVFSVLSYMGIDGSRSFTINGMKYSSNAAGYQESAADSSVKAVYEQQRADAFTAFRTSAMSAKNAERNAVSLNVKAAKEYYEAYESENYKIEPDNENECFTIYNNQGERLGVFFYSDIKCRQDSDSGKELLISENGTMWYDVLVMDQELKEDLKHVMGVDTLETEPLQGYSVKTHAGTGIQYVMKDGDEGRGGRVLLQSDADREKYEALAETYFNKYPHLMESKEAAYIWASFEIVGMAVRTENGIISLHYDGVSYNDDTNVRNDWSIRYQGDVYKQIFEWLDQNQDSHKEMHKFSFWQGILGEIDGSYERIWSDTEERQGYLNNSMQAVDKETAQSVVVGKAADNKTEADKATECAEKAFASVGASAPKEVKKAWMEAAKETGVNGLGIGPDGMITHISQMMVQRLQKSWINGGTASNDILGNSVSSAIYAAKQALYDLENPLVPESTRSIEVQRQRVKEKAFYEAFIQKLEEITYI